MRIAVVSPFVDRRHGTERALAELLERLAATYGCEVHLYAQRVEDLAVQPTGSNQHTETTIRWHRVPDIPGPQLLRFIAWLVLNRLFRLGQHFDAVLSPGINCSDARMVIVHSIFWRLRELSRSRSGQEAVPGFLRLIHRKLYYRLVSFLEQRLYSNATVTLAAVSRKTAEQLARYFGRTDVAVVYNGVDAAAFSPEHRMARRDKSRAALGLRTEEFVLLLIGNDLATKGVQTILEGMAALPTLPLRLLVVGGDTAEPYEHLAARLGVREKCLWQAWGQDVMDCYAAADVYVSPSREDSFALPVLEAMACGLPAVTSTAAGVSEIITAGVDGFVLQDPGDAQLLARIIRRLYESRDVRDSIGAAAVATARHCTWDRNAAEVWRILSAKVTGRA